MAVLSGYSDYVHHGMKYTMYEYEKDNVGVIIYMYVHTKENERKVSITVRDFST